MKKLLMALTALAAASAAWGESFTLEKGSVVCRNKAALETMQRAGGFDQLPEFLIGTACFRLATDVPGRIASEDPSGIIEVEPRQRRLLAQPANLWLERPVSPTS